MMAAVFMLAQCSLLLTSTQVVYATGSSSTPPTKELFKMPTAALVPSSHLWFRGISTANPFNFHQPQLQRLSNGRPQRQQGIRMSTASLPTLYQPTPNVYPWRRKATSLCSHPKEKSSFLEEESDLESTERPVGLELDSSIHQMANGSNSTEGGDVKADTIVQDSSSTSLELWGVPVQSIILLNLVAVIWGTQHAVIKSVVDESTIGLGAGFVQWMESMGLSLGTLQTSVSSGDSTGGDSTAAYFTLARFGLAALLASPYTPGWNLISDKFGKEESTSEVNGEQLPPEQSNSDMGEASTPGENIQSYNSDDRESIRLAWKYGAELGLYMFLGYAFQAIGLETTTASRSGFLLYLNVKFVPFFSYFIFGKQIQRSTWISALVAFGGTALLAFDNASTAGGGTENSLGMAFTVGDLWSIAAAAASAMFILRMEAASKAVPKSSELNAANLWAVAALSLLWTMGISWNQLSGTEVSVDATEFVHAIQQTFERTIATIISHPLPLIYLSGVTTALANFLQSKAQKDVSAERASVIYAMDPVYGAIFANVLLGETLGGFGLIGAFLILVAAATNAVLDFGGGTAKEEIVSGSRDEKKI